MALKYMYITNSPDVALIAEQSGVERIFVDLEIIGKSERQRGMNTVQSDHTIDDIKKIRSVLTKSELLVRSNKIHSGSAEEMDSIIESGADVIMLPYFKTVSEVEKFLSCVNGRAKTSLLLETPEAVALLDDIISLGGFDEVHIGLNDLSLGYGKKFLFEVLADGTVEKICNKLNGVVPYGFGGIASLGRGMVPSEFIIKEHYRLGSTRAILSRSFCNLKDTTDLEQIKMLFMSEIRKIRLFEDECASHPETYESNRINTVNLIQSVVKTMF